MRRVAPKTVVITGASSGLGEALALAYSAQEIHVHLFGRHQERLLRVAAACRSKGAQATIYTVDVCDGAVMRDALEAIDDAQPIDLIIANAGVSGGSLGRCEPEQQVRDIFNVNVTGMLNTIQPLLPRMRGRRAGHVAIMSSLASFRHFSQAPAYAASKAAVRVYGESLRTLLAADDVCVSVICPGFVDTPMTAKNGFFMPCKLSATQAAQRIKRALAVGNGRIAFPKRVYWPLYWVACVSPKITDFIFRQLPAKPHKH
jgi:NADP-dependent 3-hydroxy acid dehydrogenase YdfG